MSQQRPSIADFVIPRTGRPVSRTTDTLTGPAPAVSRVESVQAPTVPSFEQLFPDLPATAFEAAVTATPAAAGVDVDAVVTATPDATPTARPVGADADCTPVTRPRSAASLTDALRVTDTPVETLAAAAATANATAERVTTRSDVRSDVRDADVRPAPQGDGPAASEPVTFTAAVATRPLDSRAVARAGLAGPASPGGVGAGPVGDDTARRDPRQVEVLGVRHEARHQAARTDLDGLHEMMRQLVAAGGSDLHLTAGAPPTLRVHGDLRRLPDHGPMAADEIEALLRELLGGGRWNRFAETHELDFSHTAPGVGRFRVNAYRQRGAYGAAFRAIPTQVPALESLGLPPQVAQFAHLPRGLVLVTGPTGSGKSTTLAALIALANRLRAPHIVTIEDPIEFVHEHGEGLVNQREVGHDTESFAVALKHALRQDPDVVLVGELRDLETVATALTAAETGHLVFATLHTQSAAQTIDRVIDVFPSHQQSEVRAQLASTLRGVVTQALVKRVDTEGRAVVAEVMVATPAVRTLIREGKTHQIPSFLQSGSRDGMIGFDQHLADLVRRGVVGYDLALRTCHSTEDFTRLARSVSA